MLQLVDYSDSEESDNQSQRRQNIGSKAGVLNTLTNLSEIRPSSNDRKVKGNWAVHLSINVQFNTKLSSFATSCVKIASKILAEGNASSMIHPLYTSTDLNENDSSLHSLKNEYFSFGIDPSTVAHTVNSHELNDLHISVTRPSFIKFHHISLLVQAFEKKMSGLSSFSLLLGGLIGLKNEDESRSFLGIRVVRGINSLNRLLDTVNSTMQEFSLPLFHKEPQFHASFAWAEGTSLTQNEFIEKLTSSTESDVVIDIVKVSQVLLKVGNLSFNLKLSSTQS